MGGVVGVWYQISNSSVYRMRDYKQLFFMWPYVIAILYEQSVVSLL